MRILGVYNQHDACAAVFDEYRLIAAIAQERPTRRKGDGGSFPLAAVEECLDEAQLDASDIDVVCPIGDPFNDQDRAVAVISTGGSRFCTGSLLSNTASDARPFFMTAFHCGINAGNAASLVTFWNYYNSTCRPQGPGQSGPGDGSLSQFNTGSLFRSANSLSDFTLVELDDPGDHPRHRPLRQGAGWGSEGPVGNGELLEQRARRRHRRQSAGGRHAPFGPAAGRGQDQE